MKSIYIFCFIFIGLLNFSIYAQSFEDNLAFIKNHKSSLTAKDHNYRSTNPVNSREVLHYKHKSFIARYNPFSLAATSAMYVYQQLISPQMFRKCLYHRSCSNYSKAAIKEFGLIKGIFLSADRLMRCNMDAINDIPIGDFDPEGFAIDEPNKYYICK